MIKVRTRADAVVGMNGIVKVLLTVDSAPSAQDEHLLLNLLRARCGIVAGKNYIVTIEEDPITP